MRAIWILLLLLPLAGCLGETTDEPNTRAEPLARPMEPPTRQTPEAPPASTPAAPAIRLSLDDEEVSGTTPLVFLGAATAVDLDEGCTAPSCSSFKIDVDVAKGAWEATPGHLEFSLVWPSGGHERMELRVVAPDGSERLGRLPEDILVFEVVFGEIPITAHTVLIESAAAGTYTVEARAIRGSMEFTGVVQVEPKVTGNDRLLPNLVAAPPSDLRIASNAREPVSPLLLGLAGSNACGPDEHVEDEARRCLRFSLTVSNVGQGTLEARLPAEQLTAEDARFHQRIWDRSGGFEDVEVGRAEFHAAHGHLHYEGLADFALYAVKDGERAELVKEGRKLGFCVADLGLVEPRALGTVERGYLGEGCFTPDDTGHLWMGISPGWSDIYWWQLPDQYIDIQGVPDGVYELVATANPDGTLIESDATDNAGAVRFRLQGDTVLV